jgi:hypothetical protein
MIFYLCFITFVYNFPEEYSPILNYLEEYYILGKTRPRRGRLVSTTPPRFPPNLWNVYDSLLSDVETTTNRVECWHNRLKVIVGRAHVNVNILVSTLQKESVVIRNDIAISLAGGEIVRTSSKTAKKYRQLKYVMENRENYDSLYDYEIKKYI